MSDPFRILICQSILKWKNSQARFNLLDSNSSKFYIKSDENSNSSTEWFEDSENKLFKKAIQKVGIKQTKIINEWVKKHPTWENNHIEQKEYLKLIKSCTDEIDNRKEGAQARAVCVSYSWVLLLYGSMCYQENDRINY